MKGSGHDDDAGTARTPSRVRNARLALGMSQSALAAATRLSRQSIGAIEAGRATPAVDVALRIASALESSVEELFSAPRAQAPLVTEATSRSPTERVALAQIAGRWLSYGLDGEATWTAADGLLSQASDVRAGRKGPAPPGRVRVDPVRPLEEVHHNLVLMGCAVGLGLLADRLNSRPGAGRFLWLSR